ncbi:MAG: carboxylating nicotinate-nucleotide diphosphorylase [Gemmatimonadetes bacterium]|nr:carboxylating nicotinate-nucleotide diphosphorylase [Gemmatimonadota bacterium]
MPLPFPLAQGALDDLVRAALAEDRAFDDVTTLATVAADSWSRARMVARQGGVSCGAAFATAAFRALDSGVVAQLRAPDGSRVVRGEVILDLSGPSRALLSAERVALNFMQRLSGVATLTSRFVDAVRGSRAEVLDTRKTTPGWRALEKYAVRCGGGTNHRMDLEAAVLIKDNHLAAVGGDVAVAVRRAREMARPGAVIEVECDRIEQVEAAVEAGATMILLDNMSIASLVACVRLVAGRAKLEASGGVTLESISAIAATGVDYISVGAITHSAPAMDLALDFET